jgi:hypothetical protein
VSGRQPREVRAGQRAHAVGAGELGQDGVTEGCAGAWPLGEAGQRALALVGGADAGDDTMLGGLATLSRHVRILVATASAAFAPSEDDRVADALLHACREHRPDDQAERVRLPLGEHFATAARLTDLAEYAERLVCVGLHAAPLRHPGRRVWALDGAGLRGDELRAACAGALSVRAANARAAAVLRDAGIDAPALAVPGPGMAWAGVVESLVA